MRVLVTGATGFLGSYMARHLQERGDEVVGTRLEQTRPDALPKAPGVTYETLDVRDPAAVAALVRKVAPEEVYHFAGQAFIMKSWEDPHLTYETNLLGTLNLLEAVRNARVSPAIGYAGSVTEYGAPKVVPTPETAEFAPQSPYGASKVAADLLCRVYFERYGVRTLRYRIFATSGPGKVGDSSNDFAGQIAKIERTGKPGVLRVGNIDPKRDISDVRDAVRAMSLVLAKGTPGDAYNIARGESRSIRENVDRLVGLATVPIRVEVVEELRRPLDEPVQWADISKIRELGWSPQFSFTDTLKDILDYWRHKPTN
ncbi:MAG: GDP-mannose 4,6-dehydratase [Thermoplasmata archaeon]|jgi:GDP-mannose 4,6-dehydratase